MTKSILAVPPETGYREPARDTSLSAFCDIVESRRSVRVFESESIPDATVQECLRLSLLAPNSSNLQPWEFYWIQSPTIKEQIVEACFSQSAAKTAPTLIACIARTKTWKKHRSLMLETFQKMEQETGKKTPEGALQYYKKLVPIAYTQGPLQIFGFLKSIFVFVLGFFKPAPREPMSNSGMKIWAIKSTALACENLMLGFRAAGYDSCPMEGFDSSRVKKILKLPGDASVVMIVSAGKRASNGVYSPRIRFSSAEFIHKI